MHNMGQNSQISTTKQRILDCAAQLFSEKGFTETSIRELIRAADLKNPASLYSHFLSKNAILEHMLKDYAEYNAEFFENRDIFGQLMENPTATGMLDCLQTRFPPEKEAYYLKVLCVMLQEQLRNPIARNFVSEQIVLRAEKSISTIISGLKKLGVIRQDTDPDYWTKIASSLYYSFAARMMLGIGDNTPEFTGMGMNELLQHTFEVMLEKCGVDEAKSA